MKQLYKLSILMLFAMVATFSINAQNKKAWSSHTSVEKIATDKGVARLSFPKEFKLFDLDIAPLRQTLFTVVDNAAAHSVVISLPNAAGEMEQFEVVEASNFEPALQARFPEIRAFSGKGLTDKYATLKLSISPQGIQTMVFRADRPNEFIEPYSQDHTVYAVFISNRKPGQLPWLCSTVDERGAAEMNNQVMRSGVTGRSTGDLKTMRLAQSCNAEYSNYFGATSAAQVGLVLAAFNATMTRCNGCYEKDLAVHLNLIANTDAVIYYVPGTDPYTTMGNWNGQLQATLTSVIGEANYDIGHMFGASGGGGNAGCIGCICVNGQKGSGITSPADGIPQGDNFDIDYVVHEVGHQMGGNHTFSMSNEGSGVNKEVGSGITIMGYAGITGQDVAPHSIDIFHEATIAQIQTNLTTKTCPITTSLAGTNATPTVAAVANYIIPKSTPFALTGSAADADGDPITYCWEQNDNASSAQTGNNSVASATKATGPNWISFSPSASPTRICPKLSTILAGQFISGPLTGGDAVANTEALSSVARTLNFRLTIRDNAPYSSTPPVKVGQTIFTDMTVTVNGTSGPFGVSAPNTTGITWASGSTQTVTWTVNGSDLAPVSCSNVNILLSTDGGYTWPVVLIANTANDGSETITVPNNPSTTARIKVESVGNIFFDICNANFTITAPASGFAFSPSAAANLACGSVAPATASIATTATGGFSTPINLTATGNPAGTTVSFSPNPVTPGSSTTISLTNTNTLTPGTYNIDVTGTAGTTIQTTTISFVVTPGAGPSFTAQPADVAVCSGAAASFSSTTSGTGISYQWQVSTDGGATYTNIAGATNANYAIPTTTVALNNNKYRVIASTLCGSTNSTTATLLVNASPAITTSPANATVCNGSNNIFSVAATGGTLNYQWQVSTNNGATFTNIAGANAATYTLSGITSALNNNQYQVVVIGACPGTATSTPSILTVGNAPSITTNPTDVTNCAGTTTTFTSSASGSGLSYQWQVSTDGGVTYTNIAGATSTTYSITSTVAESGNKYRVIVSSASCATPSTSTVATLTVNALPAITTQPASNTLCSGSNITFTSAATGTGINYQWQLSTDGGVTYTNIAGATNASYSINAITAALNGYQYHVVASGTCTPAATSNAATLNVVNPATVAVQPSSTTVCSGSNATVNVTANGTGVIYQWQVSTNGGTTFTNIAGATNASYTINNATTANAGNLYHVLLSNATCTTPTVSNNAALNVNALPTVSAISTENSVCTGSPVTLIGSGASTYTWSPVGLTGSAVTVNPTVNPNTPSVPNTVTYTVTGTDNNNCSNTTTINITANPLPVVTLTATPENVALLPGRTVTLTATVSPSGFDLSWYKNGQLITNNSNTLVVAADQVGTYTVKASQNGNLCQSMSAPLTVRDSITSTLFIYPNPNNGNFTVSLYNYITNQNKSRFQTVQIYDAKGARVFKKTYPVNVGNLQGYNLLPVNLTKAASGIYFVTLEDGYGNQIGVGKAFVKP